MRLVIADTGPVNYLILIEQINLLPRLFEKIALPLAVQTELSNPHRFMQLWNRLQSGVEAA